MRALACDRLRGGMIFFFAARPAPRRQEAEAGGEGAREPGRRGRAAPAFPSPAAPEALGERASGHLGYSGRFGEDSRRSHRLSLALRVVF